LAAGANPDPGFGTINRDLTRLATMAQSADVRPAQTLLDSAGELCQDLNKNLASWRQINVQDIPSLNVVLRERGLEPLITVETSSIPACRSR
jgi:predicted kinase